MEHTDKNTSEKNRVPDTRFERTEEDLRDAFRILAARKEPDLITVSEITRLTGITRTTFYNHYEDMPSFIEAMENRSIEEIFQMIRSFRMRTNSQLCREFFRSLCLYIQENSYLARMLVTPKAVVFVEKALDMLHTYAAERRRETDVGHPTGNERDAVYRLAYSIGGIVGVLHRWAVDGCSDSPEQVADCLTRLYLFQSEKASTFTSDAFKNR